MRSNYSLLFAHYSLPGIYAWGAITIAIALFVSLFLSLKLGALILVFVAMGWWVWEKPERAVIFLLLIIPLLPLFKATQTIGNVTLIKDVIILTLFARLFAVPLLQQRLPYRRNILFAPLLALAVWVAVSLVQADSLTLGILRAREILLYPLLYLAALYLPTNATFHRRLLAWSGIAFGVLIFLSAYQWFLAADSAVLRFDPVRRIWIPRLSATLAHPSVFGQYLIMVTSFALPWLFQRHRRRQIIAAGMVSLAALLVYLTYSRAVWLGFAVSVTTIAAAFTLARFGTQASRGRLLRQAAGLIVLVFVIAGLLMTLTPVGTFVRSAFDPTYRSNEIRLEFLARLIGQTTSTEALFGAGLGDVVAQNFRQIDITSYDIAAGESRSVQLAKDSTLVDNQHLKTFIEMGLVGMLIYAWLYWRVAAHAWQLVKRGLANQLHWYSTAFGLGTLGFLAAFMLQGFFIDIWDVFPTNLLFWLIAGLLSGQLSQVSQKQN